jgi:hypothetical protein
LISCEAEAECGARQMAIFRVPFMRGMFRDKVLVC